MLLSATTVRFIRKECTRNLKAVSSVWKRIPKSMPKYAQSIKTGFGQQVLLESNCRNLFLVHIKHSLEGKSSPIKYSISNNDLSVMLLLPETLVTHKIPICE